MTDKIDKKTIKNVIEADKSKDGLTANEFIFEKPWKQEIINKVIEEGAKSKDDWFENHYIERALNLADIHHRKVVGGIKEDYSRLEDLKKKYVRLLNKRNKEISRLNAELKKEREKG